MRLNRAFEQLTSLLRLRVSPNVSSRPNFAIDAVTTSSHLLTAVHPVTDRWPAGNLSGCGDVRQLSLFCSPRNTIGYGQSIIVDLSAPLPR
jgi:hypothetical protein